MKGINCIIYENNNQTLIINIGEKNQFIYKDISKVINNELVFKYLESLFSIIDDWEECYINNNIIDGNYWKLSIVYLNGNKNEYSGKAYHPNNFEAFERLNQNLINEV